MSRNYKFRDDSKLYFVTFATVYWIDVFSRRAYRDILLESLRFCQQHKGLELYAYCIMTNHVHLIIGAENVPLAGLMRDFKKFTSSSILKAISEHPEESRKERMLWMFERAGKKNSNNKKYQFWQQDNHPIQLSTDSMARQKLDYLHGNPVEAGIVLSPEEYLYSSAKNYCGLNEYLLEVRMLW
jgi:REP element-mobilizing transposase RayT